MRRTIDLTGTWRVTHTEGLHGAVEHGSGSNWRLPEADDRHYLPVPVPGEIHAALQDLGIIPDVNLGLNSLSARWVEEQWWLYRRPFEINAADCDAAAWLVFEGLDLQAIVYLNGEEVGRHANAHRPYRLEVTGKLQAGPNLLAVAVEGGLYYAAERPGEVYTPDTFTVLTKRHWLRKPQYEAGWDWNPRLLNVGITGSVRLDVADEPWLDAVTVLPHLNDTLDRASLDVRSFVHNPGEEGAYALHLRVVETGAEVQTLVMLTPGDNRIDASLLVVDPDLWWPRGHGAQALYTVEVALWRGDDLLETRTRRTGVRRVRIMQDVHPVEGRYCIVEVNGRPIFCKGANWVPPDMIPSRITMGRLRALVDLAIGANFNFLRIWGGGLYAGHDLLDLCDEAGLLVWQDLPFACTRYPSDDPAFLAEVRAELTWAVREINSHPSLVVWCGNNEQEWGVWEWGFDASGKSLPDYALYHHVIPVLLNREDGTRPYWPSSPYSPDHGEPNDPTMGDQHPWGVGMTKEYGVDFWAYRTFVDRLPNEGGFLGASSPATLRRFLSEDEQHMGAPVWNHHDNSVNFWDASYQVTTRAIKSWLGRDPRTMGLDDYATASGLLQAEALTEYIANYRRRMFNSAAAVFWMYNDSWPVTHGWTIVDYYLRRKLAYHPVRRAFAPVTVVVAEDGDEIGVFGINDTPGDWQGELRFGLFTLAGAYVQDEQCAITLPANASTCVGTIDRVAWERAGLTRGGAFGVLVHDAEPIAQHRLFLARFGDLAFVDTAIRMRREHDAAVFTADSFVWGVCLDIEGDADVPDNAFDLLPGIPYVIPWPHDAVDPYIASVGSANLLGQPGQARVVHNKP